MTLATRAVLRTSVPTIAVVVPNWNDARYLPICLRSVLEQAVPPDELIVVDDKSTDNSVAVIRSIIACSNYATLVENSFNLGTNGALNEGLQRVTSEYVLFLSSNDFLLPGIFARAKSSIARSPGAGVWSAMAWLVDEQNEPIRLHPSPVIALHDVWCPPEQCVRLAHRFGNWFTGTTLVYHRETLEAVGGFDPAYRGLSDLLTALLVACRSGATYSPEPYAVIRVHAGSFLSGSLKDHGWFEDMLTRLRERGPRLDARLFDGPFLERTELRFRFAALRAARGATLGLLAEHCSGLRRRLLQSFDRLLPANWHAVRIAVAFPILRPFDLLPTLYFRWILSSLVRLRLRLKGADRVRLPQGLSAEGNS